VYDKYYVFKVPILLSGVRYMNFLSNELPNLLEQVPLSVRKEMWLQQDGALPHNSNIVKDFLNSQFPEKWMGTNGPILWPPRTPDLAPLDFFLWGYLKDIVYATQPSSLDDLIQRIKNGCKSILSDKLNRVYESIPQRFECCINSRGKQFEHKLKKFVIN